MIKPNQTASSIVFRSLCFLLVVWLVDVSVSAQVNVSKNGAAQAVIIHQGATNQARELQSYLYKITGATLTLLEKADASTTPDQPAILLEVVSRVPGASDKLTARQAYRLKTSANRLTLTAATELGLTYAVYGLLEDHLGCRFYTFQARGLSYAGAGYEIVPRKPTLVLPKMDDLQEPAFLQRDFIFWPGSESWVLKNRGGGFPGDTTKTEFGRPGHTITGGHNFYKLLPPETWFKEHPEWAPLRNGKRQTDGNMPFCYSNPEVAEALAGAVRREIEKRKTDVNYDTVLPISITQGDGFTACECERCRNIAREEGCESAPMFLMINRAIELVARDYPTQQFVTHGYFDTLPLPKTIRPHRNLWVNLVSSACSQNSAGDQLGAIVGNPANRDYAKALKDWPQAAPGRVTVWHWTPYQPEWPTVFYMAGNVRYWQDCGVVGVYPQLCGETWKWLVCHVFLKLAWNPKLDAEKIVYQFLEDNYGKAAAPHVWTYLKLAQAAYEDTKESFVPSAVRWSGWSQTTTAKMFPPVVRLRMTKTMDKALVAAENAGDTKKLANLVAACGASLDRVNLQAACDSGVPWGPVLNPSDRRPWFVPAANPVIPECLTRAKKAIAMSGGGEHGVLRETSWFSSYFGGPLFTLNNGNLTAAVCPDLKGQITSLVDKKSGKEMLSIQGAEAGYRDLWNGSSQIWLPVDLARELGAAGGNHQDWSSVWTDFTNPTADALSTDLIMSPSYYGFTAKHHLLRTVRLTEQGLRIERTYRQARGSEMGNTTRFTTRWRLYLPESRQAKLAVRGGGLERLLDFRYAVRGGIAGAKVGARLPGADYMDQRFDDVQAVSAAEKVKLSVMTSSTDDLVIQLDRGDGVAAVLSTPANGWEAIELQAVVEKKYLELTLVGTPLKLGKEEKTLELPVQTLSAKTMPPASAIAAPEKPAGKSVTLQIQRTGETSALNKIDQAELVLVPAGKFLRGSPKGQGSADERPQKQIHLDGYWIYKNPVTMSQYRKFCEATSRTFKPVWSQAMHAQSKGEEGSYAVQVSWYEAEAYAQWAGAALPTEAQWEKAARGRDGRIYPWGNAWDADKCVSYERTIGRFTPGFLPVGSCLNGASPYGVQDMAGNVWEWVADWYSYEYYRTAPDKNPTGPATGSHKVIRGGCSFFDERLSRTAARMICPPQSGDWTPIGFRCVLKDLK